MTRKPKAHRGFTIIELLIVLAITAVAALAAARALKSYFQDRQAQQVADSITVIGKATATWLSKNGGALPANTPTDLTLLQLSTDGDIATNFTGALPWGGTNPYYSIRVLRIPTGLSSQYKALVYTKTAWTVDGKVRFDLVGNAMRKIGGPGGMTGNPALPAPPAGPGPTGLNASWSEPSAVAAGNISPSTPYLTTGGQLFYNVAYAMASLDAIYLRTDGTNQMNAALNMGSHVINAVTDVNATGTVNAATVQAANIGATNSIVSNNTISAAGNVTVGGALTANGTVTGGNLATAGSVSANAINTATLSATDTVTAANNIRSVNGQVQAKTDVLIDDLATRTGTPLITSLKTLTPRLVEMSSYIIDTALGTAVNGAVIPKPSCINGGGQDIFIIPNKEGGITTNGKFGVVARALDTGTTWTLSVLDMQDSGNPVPSADVPNYGAVVRTFCTY